MARRRSAELETSIRVDLTPLIDVTFQLLVFVLVVNDLSQKVHEPVDLPAAAHAEELTPDTGTLVVHVLRPTAPVRPTALEAGLRLRVNGKDHTLTSLRRLLRVAADLDRPGGAGAASATSVHLRADENAPWAHVQWVLAGCAAEDVRIHRIQFATEKPTPSLSR